MPRVQRDRDGSRAAWIDLAVGDSDPLGSALRAPVRAGRGHHAVGPVGHRIAVVIAPIPGTAELAGLARPREQLSHRAAVEIGHAQSQLRRLAHRHSGLDRGAIVGGHEGGAADSKRHQLALVRLAQRGHGQHE